MALASTPGDALLHWQSISDPATAHSNMAALLIEQGRYPEARKELDLALGYNKSHAAALSNLKLVSELDGKPAVIPMKPRENQVGQVSIRCLKGGGRYKDNIMKSLFIRLLKEEQGQDLVEYALIVAAVGLASDHDR